MELTSLYIILSLAFVGLNIDISQNWPNLYGNILDIINIYNFWSEFNHHLVYCTLSTAVVIIDNIFGNLPKE
jgi:purine-cytosine permease-like protein